MTTSRPRWAATTMTITESEMSDAELDASRSVRVLVADFERGTLGLRSTQTPETDHVVWWPTPRITAAVIQSWMATILPAAQVLCDVVGESRGRLDFSGAPGATKQIAQAVDELHVTWLGRPAPRGLVAHCRYCGQSVESADYPEDLRWVLDGAPRQTDHDWLSSHSCPSSPDEGGHASSPDLNAPGHPMFDLRPYHAFEWQPAGDDHYSGSCTCRGWASQSPAPYTEIHLAYIRHTETLVTAAT